MNYSLITGVIGLVEQFDLQSQNSGGKTPTLEDFKHWISQQTTTPPVPEWEGKAHGRTPDSVISTLISHLGRYAKSYSRAAILGSDFISQEEFSYLVVLKAFGAMGKMELIRKNVHDKPIGMQVINRLVARGWAAQQDATSDKRAKTIALTPAGKIALDKQMPRIRAASKIVAGKLTEDEKLALIQLLTKLDNFHRPIYLENYENAVLLESAALQMN